VRDLNEVLDYFRALDDVGLVAHRGHDPKQLAVDEICKKAETAMMSAAPRPHQKRKLDSKNALARRCPTTAVAAQLRHGTRKLGSGCSRCRGEASSSKQCICLPMRTRPVTNMSKERQRNRTSPAANQSKRKQQPFAIRARDKANSLDRSAGIHQLVEGCDNPVQTRVGQCQTLAVA